MNGVGEMRLFSRPRGGGPIATGANITQPAPGHLISLRVGFRPFLVGLLCAKGLGAFWLV
jgi:hypothetical protein